jgi:hypothetical protein
MVGKEHMTPLLSAGLLMSRKQNSDPQHLSCRGRNFLDLKLEPMYVIPVFGSFEL